MKEKCPGCTSDFYMLQIEDGLQSVFCNLTAKDVGQPSCRGIVQHNATSGSGFYTVEMSTGESTRLFCNITNGKVVDGSCEAIKDFCQDCQSGFYTFEIFGNPTKVLCDILADNGEL